MSEFVTNSNGGFLLLILENNYNRWMEEARRVANCKGEEDEENEDDKDSLPEALYTNSQETARQIERVCPGDSKDGQRKGTRGSTGSMHMTESDM